jgi:hypothetical protein
MGPVVGAAVGFFVALLTLSFITRRWPKQGKWGINFEPRSCPQCGTARPETRRPTSFRQLWWGGWTCSNCGCEMDKYGEQIDSK